MCRNIGSAVPVRCVNAEQVTRLCESPFISQAFREQERSERVLELEQGSRAAQLKIDHLQVSADSSMFVTTGGTASILSSKLYCCVPMSPCPL